jgi:isoleucyl-tRNA synthetase
LEELSRTYIKLVRERANSETGKAVSSTMALAMNSLLRLLAPITPHITECLFQGLRKEGMPKSVHLLQLPKPENASIDKKLEEEFEKAKQLTQAVLSMREENKLRRRWPLKELVIVSKTGKEFSKMKKVLESSCNVQRVLLANKKPRKEKFAEKEAAGVKLFLNLEASPELKENWELQELRRKIQDLRKQAKLTPLQKAKLRIASSDPGFVEKHKKEIEESTNTVLLPTKKKPSEKLFERKFALQIAK